MLFVKIFYSLIALGVGFGILKYRKIVYDWTGRFYWAEKYLGSGGTVFIISLVGLGLIFWGVTYPFGVFDAPRSNTETTNIPRITP
ncbi:MAG: hypothetical protein PHH70_05020 [Candidatus Gracilibacteria bacterium]|nr:hypothetical protein [Candidatus Gracilibacteria bacterium]